MACVNKNSPEFKKILESEPNPLLAEIIYNQKFGKLNEQSLNEEELSVKETTPLSKSEIDFSNVSEEWSYKKTDALNEISNYVLSNLIKKEGKPTDATDLEKFTQLSNAVGEQEAFRDYFENNKIVRPSSVVQEKINARIEEALEFPQDMIREFEKPPLETAEDYMDFVKENFNNIIKSNNQLAALQLAQDLSEKLNIPFEVITDEQMQKLFPNQPYRQNFYRGGKVYLAEGALSASSVFHEFSHPIIKSLAKDNPKLFNSLFEELTKTDIGQIILNNLNQDSYYTPGTTEYKEEAIVQSLEALNQDLNVTQQSKAKNWFQKLLFAIKQFLRGKFGRKINISKLNSKTTLSQFVDMINYGKEFQLNQEFLEEDLFTMFETDYKLMQEQLQKVAAEKTQVVMNEFYGIARNQLSNFQAENGIFKTIEKDLADENREGLLQKTEALLENLVTIGNRQLVVPLDKLQIEGDKMLNKDVLEFARRIKAFSDAVFITDQVFDKFLEKLNELEKIKNWDTLEFNQTFAIMQYAEAWLSQITSWESESLMPNSEWTTALDELKQKLNTALTRANRLSSGKVIDVLYDTLVEQMKPVKEDFLEQMATAKESNNMIMYNKLHNEYYGITVEQMFRLNQLKAIPSNKRSRQEQEELVQLELLSYEGHEISKDQLKAYSAGILSDAHYATGLIQSFLNSQDKVVGGFAVFLQKSFQTIDGNANARRSELYRGLDKLMKDAGYGDIKSRFASEGRMGKDLSSINKSFEIDPTTGDIKEYLEYRFKSNFKDYEYDLQVLYKEVMDAKKTFTFNPNKENENKFYDAQDKLEQFLTDYMHRDYDPKYYAIQRKYLFDDLGRQAREAQNDIFRRMRLLEDNITAGANVKKKSSQMDELWNEYSQLSSIYDLKGNKKTGLSLAIAERLIEYRNEIQEFYEWEEREGVFNNTFDLFLSTINAEENTEAYDEEVKSWLLLNTQVAVKKEYYDKRTALIEARSDVLAELQEVNNINLDVGPLYEKAFALLKGIRDDYNQFNGNKLTPEAQIELVKLMTEIESMKDQWILASGVTKDELRRYRNIENFTLNNQGQFLSDEDRIFYQQFWEQASANLAAFGINKNDIEYLKEINKVLSSMTESGLTQHYLITFTKFATATEEGAQMFADSQRAVDILDGDMPLSNELFDFVKDQKNIEALKKVNPEFAEWFDRNHYLENVDEYDAKGNFIGEFTRYRSTPAWSFSNPRDINDYEARTAPPRMPEQFSKNGYIEIDGIPRVPTRSYQRRKVKAEFQTEKIMEDFVDDKGNLILANRDNKGNWLPRDFNPALESSAKDDRFIDATYKDMFKNNRAKWDLLDHIKRAHLNNQKNLDSAQKMYLSYPRYRKGRLEVYDRDYFRRKMLRINEFWKGAVDDYEEGFYRGLDSQDKQSYQSFRRPIGGSFKVPIIDVSTNIIESVMDHAYSIEQYKAMRKVNSYSNLLNKNLEWLSTSAQEEVLPMLEIRKIAENQELKSDRSSKIANRAAQVKAMIDKHLKGINLKSFNEKTQGGQGEVIISKVIGLLSKRMAFMSFAGDPIKSFTNYFGGKIMIAKKSFEGRWYNSKDIAVTRAKSFMVIQEMIRKQFSNEVPSALLQLMDVTGAIPSGLKKEIGGRAGRTVGTSLAEGGFWYADRRYLNDSGVVHQFLAMLNHASFELDGKNVSLADAVELRDGKIYSKKGVHADMSITYNDKGEIQLGKKLRDIINAHQSFLQKNIGVASEYTEPEAYRTVLGKLTLFLVKFYPGMVIDKYQIRTKKGKRGHRRLNLQAKQAEIGTYISIFKAIEEMWSGTYNPTKMSWQVRKGMLQTLVAIVSQYILRQLQMMIMFNMGDDEEFIAWNPDDDAFYNMNKVLKRSSSANPNFLFVSDNYTENHGATFSAENWFKMQALRLILRIENEERTFNPTQALFTGGTILTLQSPLADGGAIKEFWELSDAVIDLLNADDAAYIQRAPGPYVWQEEEKWKGWNLFGRMVGFKGDLLYPPNVIKREKRYFRKGLVDQLLINQLPNITTPQYREEYEDAEQFMLDRQALIEDLLNNGDL